MALSSLSMQTGYVPGLIGRVAELHGAYYAREWGFGLEFELLVARELCEFLERYAPSRDRIWSISRVGRVEASITIDGIHAGHAAHLRWFIASDTLRGQGAGQALMDAALCFCRERGYRRVQLWTFEGLVAARHLYLRNGFALAESRSGSQWGTEVVEQRYVAELDVAGP